MTAHSDVDLHWNTAAYVMALYDSYLGQLPVAATVSHFPQLDAVGIYGSIEDRQQHQQRMVALLALLTAAGHVPRAYAEGPGSLSFAIPLDTDPGAMGAVAGMLAEVFPDSRSDIESVGRANAHRLAHGDPTDDQA